MLGTSLTLSEDSATDVDTTARVYTLRAADINRSEYSIAGQTPPVEYKLTISHETTKAGNNRHLVRFDQTVVDAFGVPATVAVYTVIDRPPSTAVTNSVIYKLVNNLVDLFIEGGASANVAAILNNEV